MLRAYPVLVLGLLSAVFVAAAAGLGRSRLADAAGEIHSDTWTRSGSDIAAGS